MSQKETAAGKSEEVELLALHRKLFDAILIPQKHSERTFRKYSAADISYFGTGKDEHGESLENWVNLNLRAAEQLPQGLSYYEKQVRCRIYELMGVIEDEFVILFPTGGASIDLLTRVSAVYQKQSGTWKAVHIHVSFPSSEQTEGEAWPIEALKAKNLELEKMVADRTSELTKSLEHLQATQQQLIQSEKMASLGELTAGIAHEIQNPLNFINNFSEVNTELIEELEIEAGKGNTEEVKSIAAEIKGNEQKINHHGKRADAIVKNMLQHSGVSSGHKEATDINSLVDEYLRLSYYSARAKEKGFVMTIETHFDKAAGQLQVVPQEIGRVLLNLFNNAFYTTAQKKQQLNGNYEPSILVSTKKLVGKVEISVKDNGTGIPLKIKDKIFQPFFTTKPTGEGTGLGLSLSYDIVTKGHGGDMRVQTKEGDYAEFIISIPVNHS